MAVFETHIKMYCAPFHSKLWQNGLIHGKRLVRLHGDYINRRIHDKIVLQQSHQLSPKHIQQIHLKEEENPHTKAERIAIVVPVALPNVNPLVGSIIDNLPATDEVLKDVDSKIPKKNRTEEAKWTVTPSEDLSKLGKHYLMLSKSRLTCELNLTVQRRAIQKVIPIPFQLLS